MAQEGLVVEEASTSFLLFSAAKQYFFSWHYIFLENEDEILIALGCFVLCENSVN